MGSRVPDGLMMTAVDLQRARPHDAVQQGAGQYGDGVHRVSGHIRTGVGQGAGQLVGDVLIQGAAQHAGEQLRAPADAEEGQIPPQRFFAQRPFHFIPQQVGLTAQRMPRFAETAGRNVAAAGQQEAVRAVQRRTHCLRTVCQGHHQRQRAGAQHGVHIIPVYPIAVLPAGGRGQ